MSDFGELSARLEKSLNLVTTPVAVTCLAESPNNVAPPSTVVPAGCSFWELGAKSAIATTAEHHKFCSIGIHTHSLTDAPMNHPAELATTLAAMQGLGYVRPDEVAALPVIKNGIGCVVYAPLKDVGDNPPSVVLLFANAAQGLIISEALSRVDGAPPPALGRPACALIPQVLNSSRSAASLGCCGARAYLAGLKDDITLWGLLGEKLGAYVSEIETLAEANGVLRRFHEMRREDIESGGAPSVAQSLTRLG